MRHMTFEEAEDYIKGQDRRHRESWLQTRELSSLIYKVLTGEDLDWRFPWEEAAHDDDSNEEIDLDIINQKVERYKNILKERHGKGITG